MARINIVPAFHLYNSQYSFAANSTVSYIPHSSPSPHLFSSPSTPQPFTSTGTDTTNGNHNDAPQTSRKKARNYGCLMCHKSFDRPSTLRKHVLVHTGVKAFTCEHCNRRFSVASNRNRHAKRCPTLPPHLRIPPSAAPPPPPPPAPPREVMQAEETMVAEYTYTYQGEEGGGRTSPASSTSSNESHISEDSHSTISSISSHTHHHHPHHHNATHPSQSHNSHPRPPSNPRPQGNNGNNRDNGTANPTAPPKRIRRPPTPSHWIPPSLSNFQITDLKTVMAAKRYVAGAARKGRMLLGSVSVGHGVQHSGSGSSSNSSSVASSASGSLGSTMYQYAPSIPLSLSTSTSTSNTSSQTLPIHPTPSRGLGLGLGEWGPGIGGLTLGLGLSLGGGTLLAHAGPGPSSGSGSGPGASSYGVFGSEVDASPGPPIAGIQSLVGDGGGVGGGLGGVRSGKLDLAMQLVSRA
ncbi:hypothetical protein SISNIDRAFT_551593 [Sistotremastrum niveocremeum HHB9708]|uniref:C2H2-type domain-containing protein n=1 Tax=Sistotremastrum niveocremeum HHB9708 TaxID=1314777 RepID=A0A164R5I3_9AGAM|nr:hypothetical protein SISNIDRAFT_551593 [Sistotremastrum niveocremeum HHB9708]